MSEKSLSVFISLISLSFLSFFAYVIYSREKEKRECANHCEIYKSYIIDEKCVCADQIMKR